ncbi:MAG: hypothetical protein FWC97_08245 [Treponema sp.]|nr:hypothetical protein [Treponema sp.]
MKIKYLKIALVLSVVCFLPSGLYAQQTAETAEATALSTQRPPINVNLRIDVSSSLTDVRAEVIAWIDNHLDRILMHGDRVVIWSAGTSARRIFSGTMNSTSDREAAKSSYRTLAGSGAIADFSGALLDAVSLQSTAGIPGSGFSYTLLISASPESLTSVLSGPQANLLRHSRVEEFSGWRAIVVGLNLDARVSNSAAAFFR